MDTIKKITVEDFVKNYKESDMRERDEYVSSIITRKYVPIIEKNALLTIFFQKSLVEKNGIKAIDNLASYLNYISAILLLYTSLELRANEKTADEDYDILVESGALDHIFNEIGVGELDEIKMIYDFIKSEFIEREHSLSGYMSKAMNYIDVISESFIKGLSNTIGDISDINNFDTEKLLDTLNSFIK